MSAKSKRIFKKLISWAGAFFFLIAIGMLYWQLRKYSLYDIGRALWNIPFRNLVYASLAALTGYIALSLYDYMALRYVGQSHKISWWKWMMAGIIGFAISNNAGHAVISGGSIRYRLYTRWRIRAGDIVKMLTFSGFTYFLGVVAIVVAGFFMVPRALFEQTNAANVGVHILFVFCVASLGAYYAVTLLFQNKKVRIGELEFKIPSTGATFVQMCLGMLDNVLAGLVLYLVLIPSVDIPFTTFIGIFVIAQTAGVFSQVPGGIGVFESLFMLALPGDANGATLFGALVAYRIIYYLLPLIGAGGLFLLYENVLRARMKRWLAEAKALKDHVAEMKDKVKSIVKK